MADFTLIARKNGSSSSRREETLPADKVNETIKKWRRDDYNVFWIFQKAELIALWNEPPRKQQ